ncbi:hypothetical protein L4D76_12300 [Photobacterium sagamiensis]|uniref:hypothetical protein n=1 Tax=Photobacterium sagamiensis TaxID=2910241 RepID=UPI003D09A5A2
MQGTWHKTDTIETFSTKDWISILGNNILKSYNLIKAVELSNIEDFDIKYFYFEQNTEIEAIIPCFIYSFNLDLLTNKPIKRMSQKIRQIYPNFLRIKILFIGTPIAICDHLIGIKDHETKLYKERFYEVFSEIKKYARQIKTPLILFKEVPAHDTLLLDCFRENNIIIGHSLPNSYVLLEERLGKWTSSFKKRYRQRINRQVNNSKKIKGFKWEFINDFSAHSEVFEKLYLQILNNSDYQFESLNSTFFSKTSKLLKDNCFALICTNVNNEIVCFELIITQDDTIIPIYLGLDYSYLKEGDLYFSCINKLILYAEENNFKKIKLGQTSYLAKAYSGAIFENLILGAYSCNSVIQKFISLFHKVLFTAPPMPITNVYRDDIISTLEDVISESRIVPLNTYSSRIDNEKA